MAWTVHTCVGVRSKRLSSGATDVQSAVQAFFEHYVTSRVYVSNNGAASGALGRQLTGPLAVIDAVQCNTVPSSFLHLVKGGCTGFYQLYRIALALPIRSLYCKMSTCCNGSKWPTLCLAPATRCQDTAAHEWIRGACHVLHAQQGVRYEYRAT